MTRTGPQAVAWAYAHPTRDNGTAWADASGSWCEAWAHESGDYEEVFPTATAAALASGPLDTDPDTAQDWEYHYFSGGAGNAGHVGMQTPWGFLSTTTASGLILIGRGIGFLPDIHAYFRAKPFMKYLGHSYRHGSERLAVVVPEPPAPPIIEEDDDMTKPLQVHWDANGHVQRALFVPGTSYFLTWAEADPPVIANGFAAGYAPQNGANSTPITQSMADAIYAEAQRMSKEGN